ncbi:hypothetical protein OKA06_19145 [Novosphingobium sp. MW5]|nr:hypothetical protein [Novosphingobium sp. MW5]
MAAYSLAREALPEDIQLTEIMDIHFSASQALLVDHGQPQQCRATRSRVSWSSFCPCMTMAPKGYKTTVPRLLQEVADRQKAEAELQATGVGSTGRPAGHARQASSLTERATALKKTEVLDKTLDHLRQANREQAEFTYAISHDLKSPLQHHHHALR